MTIEGSHIRSPLFRRFALFAPLMFAAMLSGCAGGNNANGASNATNTSGANASEEAVTSVTVGYNPAIVQPQPLLGTQENEYSNRIKGVKFEGKMYSAGPEVLEALRANIIQIGCSGPFPAMKAWAKKGDIVLLGGTATGGTELMVPQSSPVKSVADLKGKAIGVNQAGSTVDAMVRYNLVQAGLQPDTDVRIITIAPGEQAAALLSGQVAAVAAPAPWPSQVAVEAKARPLLDWKQILDGGNYLAGSLYTTKKFAQEHPAFIKQFVAANRALTDDLNKDRAKGDARVLAAWSKVSRKTLKPEVAKQAFATIQYTVGANEADLQRFADLAQKVGLSKKKMDMKGFVVDTK